MATLQAHQESGVDADGTRATKSSEDEEYGDGFETDGSSDDFKAAPAAEAAPACQMCGGSLEPSRCTRCARCGHLRRTAADATAAPAQPRAEPTLTPVEIPLTAPPPKTAAAVHLWGGMHRLVSSQGSWATGPSSSPAPSLSRMPLTPDH